MKLKEKWNVWCSSPDDESVKGLTELLDEHGIKYKIGWKEPAPGGELFPIPEDFKSHWTVSFRLPEPLRDSPAFAHELDTFVPLSFELDFE